MHRRSKSFKHHIKRIDNEYRLLITFITVLIPSVYSRNVKRIVVFEIRTRIGENENEEEESMSFSNKKISAFLYFGSEILFQIQKYFY